MAAVEWWVPLQKAHGVVPQHYVMSTLHVEMSAEEGGAERE